MLNVLKRLFGSKRGQTELAVVAIETPCSTLAQPFVPMVTRSAQTRQRDDSTLGSIGNAVELAQWSNLNSFPPNEPTSIVAIDNRERPVAFSCFRVVYEALDNVLQTSKVYSSQRLDQEYATLAQLYSPQALSEGNDIRYDTAGRRFVYVYGYAATRAAVICDVMEKYQHLDLFRGRQRLEVIS